MGKEGYSLKNGCLYGRYFLIFRLTFPIPTYVMITKEWWSRSFPRVKALLLILVIFPVFIIPVLPREYTAYLYPPFFTGIFLCAAFSIDSRRKMVVYFAAMLTLVFWIAYIGNWHTLKLIIRILQIIFFFYMVAALVREISGTPTVTKTVIADAITAYLLLGFAFSLLVTVINQVIPGAYSVVQTGSINAGDFDPIRQNIYYAFITFTTTGYGDILPVAPIAKSLSILIGISGQLYIAIIISLLVGKFSNSASNSSQL